MARQPGARPDITPCIARDEFLKIAVEVVEMCLRAIDVHGAEFRLHVRAAANNGVSRDEIKEVLLHAALYAGLPAANEAYHAAQSVFDEIDGAAKTAVKTPTSAKPGRKRALGTTSRPTGRRPG